jgi:hypothetical protein
MESEAVEFYTASDVGAEVGKSTTSQNFAAS